MYVDTTLIPPPKNGNRVKVEKKEFDTQDIIDLILKVDQKNDDRFCAFAKQFEPTARGLHKLWDFVKYQIEYQADKLGDQDVKSAASLWSLGVGDCKSKTIFVNQVLRCLGIPYTIRFTSFRWLLGRKQPTHVYTVAHLPNEDIIIDTVYHFFNKEKNYSYKKDYDMGRLASISGIPKMQPQLREVLEDPKTVQELKAIKDKQSYVPKGRFIEYSKLTDGEVLAQLLYRQMQILGGMQPQNKSTMKMGEKLIDSVLSNHGKGIHGIGAASMAGQHIPKELYGIAKLLQQATKEQRPALSHSRIDDTKSRVLPAPRRAAIGTTTPPEVFKLTDVFNLPNQVSFGDYDIPVYSFAGTTPYKKDFNQIMPKICQLFQDWANAGKLPNNYPNTPFPTPTTTYGPLPLQFIDNCNQLSPWGGDSTAFNNLGSFGLSFASAQDKEAFIRDIEIVSGIYDEYLNVTMAEKANGSPGTYAIYDTSYLSGVSVGGQPIQQFQWPGAVTAKSIAQGQWFDGMSNFTGLSRANVSNIARNNIIFDSSAQPEATLRASLLYSNPNIAIEPITIISAIVAIIGAIAGAVSQVSQTVVQAKAVDQFRADNANFPQNVGLASAFNEGDWPPPTGAPLQGGTGAGTGTGAGGNNTGLILGGAALLGAAWYFSKDQ